MKNAPQQTYMGLTLYKPDIIELASIFHNNFQHVEIFIDDIPLLNSAQLDACHPEYQAKTLLMRGLCQETTTDEGHEFRQKEEHPSTEVRVPPLGEIIVEIKAGRRNVTVVGLPGKGKQLPPAAQQITQFFTERTSGVFPLLLLVAVSGSVSVPLLVVEQAIQKHLPSSLDIFSGVLLSALSSIVLVVPLMLVTFRYTTHVLGVDKYVYLLPGATNTTKKYGRYEVVITFVVFVVLLILTAIIIVSVEGIMGITPP